MFPPDVHTYAHDLTWGIRPMLFSVGFVQIPSYGFFVFCGLVSGIAVTWFFGKHYTNHDHKKYFFEIMLAGVVGGIVGAKLPIWIYYFPQILDNLSHISILLSGRTIVGGLIGGVIAVGWVKKRLHIQERMGNILVPGIVVGILIGRIGCFLRGCCYGVQTTLPWGVDFGDGVMRHPTQIYEIIFLSVCFLYILVKIRRNVMPGQLFDQFLIAYFLFRFMIEFIRVEPEIFLQLTMFQWLSLGVIGYVAFLKKYAIRHSKTKKYAK